MVSWSWSIGWCWSISWSWGISWSRGISWSWGICRSWSMVSILVVLDQRLVWTGGSLVLDISVVLLVLINKVVHDLHSAVWQLHSVLTFDIVSISLLGS